MASIMERIRAVMKPTVVQISLGSDAPTQVLNYTAKELYNSQDNLQAVVNYMANSIAQLPLKVYRRDGETDRERDRDSAAAKLLWKPNSDQTAYEFVRGLAIEYLVFGCVYAWVVPDMNSDSGYQMRIIPSDWVTETIGGSAYSPEFIRVRTKSGQFVDIPRDEFVQFKTYSPGNPGGYISPISGLRQTLQEQIEAGRFRKQLWHSSGRLNAQITRPKDVQPWDDEARKKFITAFREGWGSGGEKAGSIPLLEDGMEIKPFSTSFKESQWAESVKLSRESVAAAYGINPSLIWHSDTQTYASSKDNARALYAECLGPILQMIQQRINAFLLPMVGADSNSYVEFDLTEKLKGSFEERASILQSAVGGPWMTRNEARADNNLPPVEGGDDLIVPLNVIEGGQASPTDTHMDEQEPMAIQPTEEASNNITVFKRIEHPMQKRIKGMSTEEEEQEMAEVVGKFLERQKKSVVPKIGADKEKWWDADRWNSELADDIEPVMHKIFNAHGRDAAREMGTEYSEEITKNYVRKMAEGRAEGTNESTKKKLDERGDKSASDVFDERIEYAITIAASIASATASRGLLESVEQARSQGYKKKVEKMWVTGDNPRPSHAAMDGEVVPIDSKFSNGADWPGDDVLGPEETCGCNCTTEVIITEE